MNQQNELEPALSPQQRKLTASARSPLAIYREMSSSGSGFFSFLYQEGITTLFSSLPGILGLTLRSFSYRLLFRSSGKRPVFGRSLLIRSPKLIELGDRVMLDDFVTLDARSGSTIIIDSYVSLGRFTSLICKGKEIRLHRGVNIGSHCRIATQSSIEIGQSTLVAAYCYIGPGNHTVPEQDTPIIEQEMELRGGVRIGEGVWIGTRVTILDGVTVGDGAVIGAHSLVREDVPAGAIVVGTPARIVGQRSTSQSLKEESA